MIIIVVYISLVILIALLKKVDTYQAFIDGVNDSFGSVIRLFPSVLAIVFSMNIFINSGILEFFTKHLNNFFISPKILLQIFLKPISWSSSLLMMIKIFETEGVNSFSSYLSSIIQGSFDTTIYVIAMYFSSIKVTKTKYSLKVGLISNFLIFIVILVISYIFF